MLSVSGEGPLPVDEGTRRHPDDIKMTASAQTEAGTKGASASVGVTEEKSGGKAEYIDGMAIFTVAKGGLMYEAVLAGQKFSYKPRGTQ